MTNAIHSSTHQTHIRLTIYWKYVTRRTSRSSGTAFLSSTLSPSLFALNFKSAFTLSFSCKSPPEWIFSHLFSQALLACSQTMNKHISTQINAAKQARNEETHRRNMRVHNCQRSRFGFVARQLCGHHRNIYRPIEI